MKIRLAPTTLRAFHLVAMLVWLGLVYPSVTVWRESVPWLVFMSLYANFVGHFASWQSARAEVREERHHQERKNGPVG